DVRIETAARCRHQIDGHRRRVAWIGAPQRGDALFDCAFQRRVDRALVRAARSRAVVRLRTSRRRTAPEVLRTGKALAQQVRAHGAPAPFDDAAVRAAMKRCLPYPGDDQWISDAREHRKQGEHDQGGTQFTHSAPRSMSMTLMPANGSRMPPTP